MIPELTGSSLPASTSSAGSGKYHSLHSSQHQVLGEIGATDSNVLLRVLKDNEAKDGTIKTLQQQVNKMLKYAEPLEEQILQLTTEVSKHEEEKRVLINEIEMLKRKANVSHPLTQTYAHEQKQQELAQHYEQQYYEEKEGNSQLQKIISQLQKENEMLRRKVEELAQRYEQQCHEENEEKSQLREISQLEKEIHEQEEEKQILRREVETLKHKASVSYSHEQRLQELVRHYKQQYHEEKEENHIINDR